MRIRKTLALAMALSILALASLPLSPAQASSFNTTTGTLGVSGGSPISVNLNSSAFTVELTLANVLQSYQGIALSLSYNKNALELSGNADWLLPGGSGETNPSGQTDPNAVTQWGYVTGRNNPFPAIGPTPVSICSFNFKILAPAGTAVNETITVQGFSLMRVEAVDIGVPDFPRFDDISELFPDLAITVRRTDSGGTGPGGDGPGSGPGGGGTTTGPTPTPGSGQSGSPTPTPTPAPTPTPGAGGDDGTQQAGGSTYINEQETPLGFSFLKAHVQFILGYPDGTVLPDTSITRAEAVSIFFRLIDDAAKDTPIQSTFADVPSDEWYVQSVAYAAKMKIVIGYPDGGFHPEDNITRAEFATIMSRFVSTSSNAAPAFSDVPADHWAAGYISTCVANGWIMGYPDGTFAPENPISRAEAVTILNRALNRGIAMEDIPPTVPTYTDLPTSHWAYTQIIEASVAHEFTRNAGGTEVWN